MEDIGMNEKGAKILVVDDEEKNRKILDVILRHHGYQTAMARNGVEALALCKTFAPDLILLDIMMPEMDGFTACRMLREEERFSHIPVVMVTALADRESKIKGLEAGASDFLSKPVDKTELLIRVRNLLKVKEFADFLKIHNGRLEEEVAAKTADLRQALQKEMAAKAALEKAHARLLESEKLASLGLLAAGIAHEINNPLAYVIGTLDFLSGNLRILDRYVALLESSALQGSSGHSAEEIAANRMEMKIDHVRKELVEDTAAVIDGTERIKQIIRNLQAFSRRDEAESSVADINDCLERAIAIAWHEIKSVATVHRQFDDLPLVRCFPQQLTQVFINLLVNAAQAIKNHGDITVRTWHDNDRVHAAITDTGGGISPEILEHIFVPLFTTKEAGKGTGLGLSISHDIVTKHGGEVSVQSQFGRGSTFTVSIPVTDEART
jgi:signal transduction histidine kinase